MMNKGMRKMQFLRQLHVVIEWRDGCVFKTRQDGLAWVTSGSAEDFYQRGDEIRGSLSTKLTRDGKLQTMRMVDQNAPDFVRET
jgi:hypothetical protein